MANNTDDGNNNVQKDDSKSISDENIVTKIKRNRFFILNLVFPMLMLMIYAFFSMHKNIPEIENTLAQTVEIKVEHESVGAPHAESPQKSTPAAEKVDQQEIEDPSIHVKPNTIGQVNRQAILEQKIQDDRIDFENNPDDPTKAMYLGALLEFYSKTTKDNKYLEEAITMLDKSLTLLHSKKLDLRNQNLPTDIPQGHDKSIPEDKIHDLSKKSIDALIADAETSKANIYFESDRFELSKNSLENAILLGKPSVKTFVLLGKTSIVLGKYETASHSFIRILESEENQTVAQPSELSNALEGLLLVISVDESFVPGGWDSLKNYVDQHIESYTQQLNDITVVLNTNGAQTTVPVRQKPMYRFVACMHLVLFHYYDKKKNKNNESVEHLDLYAKYKSSSAKPYDKNEKMNKVLAMKKIMPSGFFVKGLGNPSTVPIFIIGFPRSGSTLTERILNGHPMIAGLGEHSELARHLEKVLGDFRRAKDLNSLNKSIQIRGQEILAAIRQRYDRTMKKNDGKKPIRFVDKMLVNYLHVGFIHAIFPNALILHTMRDPMDCLFSVFKHEFQSEDFDFTTDFTSLAQSYIAYRDMIDHWEQVLPGRITHLVYEDITRDPTGIAKAIINATGLPWNDDVLDFNKKKFVTNTMSTGQVNKGIYSNHLNAWKKYESYLQPLADQIGDKIELNYQTTLKNYDVDKII